MCIFVTITTISLVGCGSERVTRQDTVGTYTIDVRDDAGNRYRDTLVLNPDGTLDQTYQPPGGGVMKAHGTWEIKDEWDGTTIDLHGWINFERVMRGSDRGIKRKAKRSDMFGAGISGVGKNVRISLNPDLPDRKYVKVKK